MTSHLNHISPSQGYFYEDDEHNAGAFLLDLLVNSDIMNRAIFVVRKYDGDHIGADRYKAMFDVVCAAVDKAPLNSVTNRIDKIWYADTGVRPLSGASNLAIRGRPRRNQRGQIADKLAEVNNPGTNPWKQCGAELKENNHAIPV